MSKALIQTSHSVLSVVKMIGSYKLRNRLYLCGFMFDLLLYLYPIFCYVSLSCIRFNVHTHLCFILPNFWRNQI